MKRTKATQDFGLPGIGVPAEVLFHPELTSTEKLLFGLLRNLSYSEKGCWASNSWLGGVLGVKPQTISNGIARLSEWHFLVVSYNTRSDGARVRTIFINTEYPLIYKEITGEAYKNINRGLLKKLYTPIKKLIPPYKKIYNNKDIEKDIEEDIIPPNKNVGGESDKPSIETRNKIFLPLAKHLSKTIQKKKNITHTALQIKSWANEIRKLSEMNNIEIPRIKQVLGWYRDNIGGEYVPEVESGASLRNKFVRLEAAMTRGKAPHHPKPNTIGHRDKNEDGSYRQFKEFDDEI